jgi:hypothetical protein
MIINEKIDSFYHKHKALSILLFLFIVLPFIFATWYFSIPLIGLWYLHKRTALGKKGKTIGTIVLAIVAVTFIGGHSYSNKAPTFTSLSPQTGVVIHERKVMIEGVVKPAGSKVSINGENTEVKSNGSFSYMFFTPNEANTATVVATNNNQTESKTITITREFSEQEKADMAAAKLKAEQEKAIADAKAKAEEEAYAKSPAGKICNKHPEWTKDDCESIAKHEVWIGMTLDMLKAQRGLPDNVNKSNYGSGIRYQWCWTNNDYSSECFYGGADGIITSYN